MSGETAAYEAPFPWQEEAWRGLMRRVREGRLPHALLLGGPAGMGKRAFAAALAARLLCEQPTAEETACGGCPSCLRVAAGTHPDLKWVEPEEAGKPITIAQIRAVVEFQALKAQYSGYRVIVVQPAERMNPNAANALLKTLEEPGEGSLLLLLSERPTLLMPTIRSRCQNLPFRPPPATASAQWLRQRTGDSAPSELLLALAGGAPLAALALAEADGLAQRKALWEAFEAVVQGANDPVVLAEAWSKEEAAPLLGWFHGWLTDAIRLKCGASHEMLANPDLAPRLQALAETVDLEALFRRLETLTETLRALSGQVNRQLLFENLLIEWAPSGSAGRPAMPIRG